MASFDHGPRQQPGIPVGDQARPPDPGADPARPPGPGDDPAGPVAGPVPLPPELREHLLLAQKMETIGALASGVKHELSNSLTAVRGYGELIATDPYASTVTREDARRIGEAGEKAIALVTTFADFARERPTTLEVFGFDEVLDGVLSLLRFELMQPLRPRSSAGVTVERDIPATLPRVVADRGRVQQIVITLLQNALDAFKARAATLPEPVGVAGRIEISAVDLGAEVACRIRDDGPGVPPEVASRLFRGVVSTRPGSNGLGLWVAANVAAANGGSLTYAPAPGGGADFTLRLPRATPTSSIAREGSEPASFGRPGSGSLASGATPGGGQAGDGQVGPPDGGSPPDAGSPPNQEMPLSDRGQGAATPPGGHPAGDPWPLGTSAAAGGRGLPPGDTAPDACDPVTPPSPLPRVLLVDDEAALLSLGRRYVNGRPASLDTASGGAEALERCAAIPYDLVLLDGRMPPGPSGALTCRALMEDEPRDVGRVAVLTGGDLDDDLDRLRRHAGVRVIAKQGNLTIDAFPALIDGLLAEIAQRG